MSRRPTDRPAPPFQAADPSDVLDVDLDDDERPADPWNYDTDTAPKDGTEVALRIALDGEAYHVCVWRKSRQVRAFQWQPLECWSDALSRQMLPDFVPVAWARYDVIDGLKRAG